jgi:hypothetical protein
MTEASRIAKSIQESVEAEFGPLTTKQQVRDALNRAFPTASGNAEALLNSAEAWDENTSRVKAVRNFAIGLLHMSQQDPQTAARITRLADLDTKDPNHGGTHSPRADIYNGTFQSWTISMNPSLNVNSLEPEKREMGEPWAYKMALSMKETGDFSDDEINQILQQSVAIHEFGHAMHLSAGLSHWGNDRGGAIPSEAMIQAFANVKKISVSDANDEINAFIQKYDTRGRSDQTISGAITTLVRREPEGEQAFFNELYDTIKWDGVDKDETTRAKILEDLSKASEYATTGGKRGMGSQYDEGVAETIAVMVATGTPASGGKETLAHVQSIFPGSAAPPPPSEPDAPKPTSPTPGSDPAQSSNKVITDPNDVDLYYYPGNRMEDNTWVRREELDESFEDFISGLTDSEKETALRELGFESEDELVRYLTDETLTDVAEQIDSLRKTPIMMALPPDALLSILRDQRFNSQFVTGTSVGGYNPEGRKESEFEKLGVPVDIPDELRPVYGFQVPDDYEGPVTESAAGKIYGSLVVVFKKSPRGRSTMTGGDSVLEDRVSAISVDGRVQDEALLGAAREDHYALGQARTENKFFTDVLNSPERQGELIDIESRDYSEVQIHGGATLDEVEKVVFSRRLDAEARAKVVAELEKAGIRYEDDKQ